METFLPYLFSSPPKVSYQRERLELSDGDFLDLDWLKNGNSRLIVLSHGFEGNSKDHFILASADYFSKRGFDILIWHYRSCSGELNRLPRFYHHGDVDDLDEVLVYALKKEHYDTAALVGFSMGGNLIMNYLGQHKEPAAVKGGIVFSTPMDLAATARRLSQGLNRKMERIFIKKWKKKLQQKAADFPKFLDLKDLDEADTMQELLASYLLSVHGFSSLSDYYEKWSSGQFIDKIKRPILIVNAKNDPLLSSSSYPYQKAENSEYVFLETPKYGGHTGFTGKVNGTYWYLKRMEQFFSHHLFL